MTELRIALAQTNSTVGDLAGNAQRIAELYSQAQNVPALLILVVPSVFLVFVIVYVLRINKKIDQVIIR